MATTEHALAQGAWTDLGSTPCFVQNLSNTAVTFVIDAAAPASAGARGHVLTTGANASADIALSGQRVFARAYLGASASIVVSR